MVLNICVWGGDGGGIEDPILTELEIYKLIYIGQWEGIVMLKMNYKKSKVIQVLF